MNLKQSKIASIKMIFFGIVAIALVLFLALAYFVFLSSNVQAQLHVESGVVKVNGNIVSGDVVLNKDDVVETIDGFATVILHESILVSLQQNTKVALEDLTKRHPIVRQNAGTTWNKFVHLAGIDEFSVKTSNSIASVRGTAFSLSDDKILTSEGEVSYAVDGQSFEVPAGDVVERKGKIVSRRAINNDEMVAVKKHFERAIKTLKHVRSKEIKKHSAIVNMIKRTYGIDDKQIEQGLDDVDRGKSNIDEIAKKSPVKPQSMSKVIDITKEIQKMNSALDGLNRGVKLSNNDLKKS